MLFSQVYCILSLCDVDTRLHDDCSHKIIYAATLTAVCLLWHLPLKVCVVWIRRGVEKMCTEITSLEL